jgi:glycosyltransferase involved in cell wall biosynthesis
LQLEVDGSGKDVIFAGMTPVSIVIICKNESAIIGNTLANLAGVSDDIIVYDNGSTDGTQDIARKYAVKVVEGPWEGFGKTKTKANTIAKYDWILSLDADESLDDRLKNSIRNFSPGSPDEVYDLKFKNFLGNKHLKYGEWGGDRHIRLFNRQKVTWDDAAVHEQLIFPAGVNIKSMWGYVLHLTMRDMDDYARKMAHYAMLNAQKYHTQGKRSSWFKIRMSPGFTFINYYLLKLGFLDGHAGYICAKMTAWYTFLKYARLRELEKERML